MTAPTPAAALRPARFPLRPGRPLMLRRPNGGWGFACACAGRRGRSRFGTTSFEAHNRTSHAAALADALDHLRREHMPAALYLMRREHRPAAREEADR